jgi:type IV secretory pathway TrbL component
MYGFCRIGLPASSCAPEFSGSTAAAGIGGTLTGSGAGKSTGNKNGMNDKKITAKKTQRFFVLVSLFIQ